MFKSIGTLHAVESGVSNNGIRYVGYPQQGVILGQGWDSLENRPANATCISFSPALIPGHDIEIKFHEIFSRHQLNKAMNLTVSGGYSGVSGSVNGSLSYSKSLDIDRSNRNVLSSIQVWKGDEFVSPINKLKITDETTPSSIMLSKEAIKVLQEKDGGSKFRKMCGDKFVYHIKKGGKLYAYFSFDSLDEVQKQRLSASLSASGYGAKLQINGIDTTNIKFLNEVTNINIFQTGGPFQNTPVNLAEFSATVRGFLGTSDADLFPTKPFEIGLMNYTDLYNFSSTSKDNLANYLENIEDLITMYWLFDDLRKQYTEALVNNQDYLFNQPSNLDEGTIIKVYQGQNLCEYKLTSNEWKLTNKDVCTDEKGRIILNNSWNISNVITRLGLIKAHAIILKEMIDFCYAQSSNPMGHCDSKMTISKYLKEKREVLNNLINPEKNQTKEKLSLNEKLIKSEFAIASLENEKTIDAQPYIAMLEIESSKDEYERVINQIKTENEIEILHQNLPGNINLQPNVETNITQENKIAEDNISKTKDLEKVVTPEIDQKKEILWAKLSQIIKNKTELSQFKFLFNDESDRNFIETLSRNYYELSILSPIKVRAKNIVITEYKDVVTTDKVPTENDLTPIVRKIRRDKLSEHVKFAETFCSEDVRSKLCKSVSEIQAILNSNDTRPLFTIKTEERLVIDYQIKHCGKREKFTNHCLRDDYTPVYKSVTDFITNFSDFKDL